MLRERLGKHCAERERLGEHCAERERLGNTVLRE